MSATRPRRLVLCLDGTWKSTYDKQKRQDGSPVLKPSNVLKLCRAVKPQASGDIQQIVYYDLGVGALADYPGTANRLLYLIDRGLGGYAGAGFESNVEDALNFIVLNHQDGDELFLFGFSRGAATARAVTHFIDWAGGLPSKNDAYYLPELFRAYVVSKGERTCADVVREINEKRAAERRPLPQLGAFQKIRVEFLGVWDTVMALGSRFRAVGATTSTTGKSFHVQARPARCVDHARQALAIDEVRFDYRPEIWEGPATDDQSLQQRWFAGVHSNIGGGYVDDGLANLAFQWICGEARARGLDVDEDFTNFYRGFPQDRLYRSDSLVFRFLDGFRWRFGRGKRQLVGRPPAANLELHRSVIHRIGADPEARKKDGTLRFPELMRKPYRPQNVLQYLACKPDLEPYLAGLGLEQDDRRLPDDVLQEIGNLKGRCPP